MTDAIDALCREYTVWNSAQGLRLGNADEHLFDDRLTPEQQAWVRDFSNRWEKGRRGG